MSTNETQQRFKARIGKGLLFTLSILLIPISSNAHSGTPTKAWEACEEKAKSDKCEYKNHHDELYRGTCQMASNKTLICVRNQPIVKPKK